jgi:hypothetical protein
LEDLQALQLQTSTQDVSDEAYSTAAIAKPYVTEKVNLTSGGKCLQNRMALRFLASVRQQMRFATIDF